MEANKIVNIPVEIFKFQGRLKLSAGEILLICNVLAAEGSVSVKEMAEHMGISERHIHNLKNRLISKGYLRITGKNQNMVNKYDLSGLFAVLGKCAQKENTHMKYSSGEGVKSVSGESMNPASCANMKQGSCDGPAVLGDVFGNSPTDSGSSLSAGMKAGELEFTHELRFMKQHSCCINFSINKDKKQDINNKNNIKNNKKEYINNNNSIYFLSLYQKVRQDVVSRIGDEVSSKLIIELAKLEANTREKVIQAVVQYMERHEVFSINGLLAAAIKGRWEPAVRQPRKVKHVVNPDKYRSVYL